MEIFGANLKMNPVPKDNKNTSYQQLVNLVINGYLSTDHRGIAGTAEKRIIVFAPFTHLPQLRNWKSFLNNQKIELGSQDVSEQVSGAYTRQISPVWLKELGVSTVLIGHSEVRKEYEDILEEASPCGYYAEAIDRLFNRKIRNALAHGLEIVYCVGETEKEKQKDETKKVIKRQIIYGLNAFNKEELGKVIIAYEPRWAIGGGKPIPSDEEIRTAHNQIRENACEVGFNLEKLIIMYGGSMDESNAGRIMAIPGVNGGLIGSASLNSERFAGIVNYRR